MGRYNIRIDLTEIGCEVVCWIRLAQGREQWQTVVNSVMNVWVP
jgi:hypothetical protein